MSQIARNLTDSEDGFLDGMEYFVCDHDVFFTKQFEAILESSDVKLLRTRVATPQQNGFAERFIKSIKEECLNKLIFFGEKSLTRAVNESVEHYHHESPRSAALATNHQGLDNLIPFPYAAQTKGQSGSVVKFERLGGLLNYYHRERESPIEGSEVKSALNCKELRGLLHFLIEDVGFASERISILTDTCRDVIDLERVRIAIPADRPK